jgi:hypothetical protein
MMDEFLLDEEAGVAYVTTHRKNNIDRMFLEPDRNEERESVAGNPFDEELVGPSSGAWGRAPGEASRGHSSQPMAERQNCPPTEFSGQQKKLGVAVSCRVRGRCSPQRVRKVVSMACPREVRDGLGIGSDPEALESGSQFRATTSRSPERLSK